MFRFLIAILRGVPGWLGYFALMTPLVLLGFPLVAFAAWRFWYADVGDDDGYTRTHWTKRWLWLFDNGEDGIDGDAIESVRGGAWKNPAWVTATKDWSTSKLIFVWSAWRNSVGNARLTSTFGMTVDPKAVVTTIPGVAEKIQAAVNQKLSFEQWWAEYRKLGPYVARQGSRAELRFPWSKTRFFWIGWRIAQQDEVTKDVGFAFQPFAKL